jgi:hypothetical protein
MSRHQKQGDRRSYIQMCRQKASQEKQNFPWSDSDNGTDHPMGGV